jgi:hypothetical protein
MDAVILFACHSTWRKIYLRLLANLSLGMHAPDDKVTFRISYENLLNYLVAQVSSI